MRILGILVLVMAAAVGRGSDPAPVRAKATRTLDAGWAQAVFSVGFSADGKTLVGSGEWFSLQAWDLETGKLRTSSHEDPSANTWAGSVGVSADGRTAFVGVGNGIQVWDARTGKKTETLVFDPKMADADNPPEIRLAVHPDGKLVAATGKGNVVKMWNVPTRKQQSTIQATGEVKALTYSSDGKFLIGCGVSRSHVWDGKTGKLVHEFRAALEKEKLSRTAGESLAVSRDGKRLAFATEQSTISIWSLADAKEMGAVPGRLVSFSKDVKFLFVQNGDGIEVIGAEKLELVSKAWMTNSTAHAMAVSPDGDTLAVGYDNGRIILWDVTSLTSSK